MEKQDNYLDIKSLSKYSSLSVSTLRNYLAKQPDPIPSYCVKRKILVKKSDFDAWMARHRTHTNTIASIADEVLDAFNAK